MQAELRLAPEVWKVNIALSRGQSAYRSEKKVRLSVRHRTSPHVTVLRGLIRLLFSVSRHRDCILQCHLGRECMSTFSVLVLSFVGVSLVTGRATVQENVKIYISINQPSKCGKWEALGHTGK